MLQRTDEWRQIRCGKVTASRLADVMAEPTKKKKDDGTTEATTRRNYRRELALERLYGHPQESGYTSFAMQQGIEREAEARENYKLKRRLPVEEVGFVVHPGIPDSGSSPDGLVGSDGVLEIKSPEANAMWEMLTKHAVERKYVYQVQWALACTGRRWADIVFYRTGCPLEIIRLDRDDLTISELETAVRAFSAEVDADAELVRKRQQW